MSKLKAVKPKEAKQRKAKILVYGRSGVGKTWCALDFPAVYYIDTEGGATEKRYVDKLEKAGGVYLGVEEGSQDFAEIIEQVKALGTEKHPYKTLVIDSISKIYNMEIANEMERLGDKDQFGASKKPAIQYTRKLINWLEKIDMNVILISHEKALWKNGEQAGETFDAWDKLEYELDLSLQIKKIGADNRKAYVKKSRLEAFPEASNFIWSYEEFAEKFGKDVIEGEITQIELATEEQVEKVNALLEIVKVADDFEAKCFKKAACEAWNEMESERIAKVIEHLEKIKKGE